jgi:hypothetical protein
MPAASPSAPSTVTPATSDDVVLTVAAAGAAAGFG